MSVAPLSVLALSFVGSLHCAGMCGPLVVFVGGGERPRPIVLLVYHLARLGGYLLLGLLAGAFGAAVDLGGQAVGLGRVASFLAGLYLIAAGTRALLGPQLRFGAKSSGIIGRGSLALTSLMGRASRLDRLKRSFVIGGLTAFLPCGWLYAFLAAAASTGNAFEGGLVMTAFWLGSVPILLGLGLGSGSLLGPLRRRAPTVVAVLLVGLGLFTVSGRFGASSFANALGPGVGERVLGGELTNKPLPCCEASNASDKTHIGP